MLARQQEKPHVLNQAQLSIRILHEFPENQEGDVLDDTDGQETTDGGTDKAPSSQQSEMKGQKLHMAVDPDVMEFVTTTAFCDELSNSLATKKSGITWKPNNKMAEIVYKGRDDSDSWQSECSSEVQNYLGKFEKRDVQVNNEFWSAVMAQLSDEGLKKVQSELEHNDTEAVFVSDKDSGVRIVSTSAAHWDKAEKLVNNLILTQKVHVDDKSESLLKTPEWRKLCNKINDETAVRIHSNNWNATYVTGFQDDVIEVMKKLNTFLESNSIREEQFTCSSQIVRRYLAEFLEEDLRCIEIQLKEYEVKIEKGKGDDDFDISGNRKSLTDVRGLLDTLVEDTESKVFDVKQPGLRSYFDNGQGDRLVKLVEKDQNCAIQVERIFGQSGGSSDSEDDESEDEHAVSSSDPFSLVMTKGHHKISWRIGKIETEKVSL